MNLKDYQAEASRTDEVAARDPGRLAITVLGLLSEAGSISNIMKKFLRDGLSWDEQKSFLEEELGDLLWYLANTASRVGLDLETIAEKNLARTRDRHQLKGDPSPAEVALPLDEKAPTTQRFPRQMKFRFTEASRLDGKPIVTVTVVSAEPNVFPQGVATDDAGKRIGFSLGDPLTDNNRGDDAYRYHDAFHIANMAVLGWSPVVRVLLRLKRKYDKDVDETEDGARAKDIEEGFSTYLFQRSKRYGGFLKSSYIDNETLDYVREHVRGLEVSRRPLWLWKHAIAAGFVAWDALSRNHGGYLEVDLDNRTVLYSKL